MSDQLENWFKENRELLDQDAPPKGHAERFAKRLNASPSITAPHKWTWAAAAMVAVLIAGSFLLGRSSGSAIVEMDNTLSSVSSEMAEVEDHFAMQVAMKMEHMRTFANNEDDTQIKKNLEILSQLEKEYDLLKSDLAENPKDERVINSMIMNYRVRIKVMDRMLEALEAMNNKIIQDELHI